MEADMIKVVIFDVDGTLIDSVDLHAQAWQETFKHFGREVDFAAVRHQIGKGADQLLPVFFSAKELQSFGKELEAYRSDLFKRNYLPHVRPFPNVRDLFQHILADERRILLATSAQGDELKNYKRLTQIEDLIEDETSADDVERSKPHPDIFAAALKKAGDPAPSEVIVIGDTPYDTEAAAKLELPMIGLLSGGFPEIELRGAGCIAIYRDPADLLEQYTHSPLKEPLNRNRVQKV